MQFSVSYVITSTLPHSIIVLSFYVTGEKKILCGMIIVLVCDMLLLTMMGTI